MSQIASRTKFIVQISFGVTLIPQNEPYKSRGAGLERHSWSAPRGGPAVGVGTRGGAGEGECRRGTSPIRKCNPLGPYLWWSEEGGWVFLYERGIPAIAIQDTRHT